MGRLPRHRRPRRALRVGPLLLLTMLLSGCGSGGSDTPPATPAPTSTAPVVTTTVAGMVSKGPVAGATITLFTLLPTGQRGRQVAPEAGLPPIGRVPLTCAAP
jgi:hypothetical protein